MSLTGEAGALGSRAPRVHELPITKYTSVMTIVTAITLRFIFPPILNPLIFPENTEKRKADKKSLADKSIIGACGLISKEKRHYPVYLVLYEKKAKEFWF